MAESLLLALQLVTTGDAELLRLFSAPWPSNPRLRAVIANFKPLEIDAGWRFWRRLDNVGDQLKFGAASLLFDGPNDLVVDTGCMIGPNYARPRVEMPDAFRFEDARAAATANTT